MKLEELIDALANEIDLVKPQLGEYLDALSTLDTDSSEFIDHLELYSSQIERMGEAADMVGFSGLQDIAKHLQENTLLLSTLEAGDRHGLIAFLRQWPELMTHYLHHLDDPSVAAGLVDNLRDAPHPMSEEQCLRVMHKLGAVPIKIDLGEDSSESQRPVLLADEDVSLDIPDDVEQKLMDSFLQEAPQQVSHLVTLIGNIISENPADMSDLTAAKRVAHTLKGTGAIIGIKGLATLGHHFEDILEFFESQEGEVPESVNTILVDTAYCFEQMVGYIGGQDDYPQQLKSISQDVLDLANRIDKGDDLSQSLRRGGVSGQAATNVPKVAAPIMKRSASAALRIGLDKIEEMFRMSAEISVHTAAMEAKIKSLSDNARVLLKQHLKVKKRLYELETVVDVRTISMMRNMSNSNQAASFDPLEMEQYNELHSTAHAMVEDASDAILLASHFEEAIAQLAAMQTKQQTLSNDLQHLVIGTRMAEVGTLEPRLQRNIRTTSQATGKQAALTIIGGNTLIDSDVLAQLSEPLLHLLRNAIDHGLESPNQRIDANKDPIGQIRLEFSKQGQQVVLRCIDDGRGLNYETIRKRAIEKGLITEEQQLSEEEMGKLVFMSGFSTRDEVSQVSGRGVGMDVVSEWANRMNGVVSIHSTMGQGTVVELRFAASLSTVQSLIVETSGQNFALPSLQVEQALARGVGEFVFANDMLQFRHKEDLLAARFLSDLIGLPRNNNIELADYNAVIVKLQGEVYALAVDQLIDSRELLVKDPGRYTRHLPEIAGISILGDGSITAHLDLSQLINRKAKKNQPSLSSPLVATGEVVDNRAKVLIVDDSLSVRNVLQELVEDMGYISKTARDGVDAVETLDEFTPDLLLTDLEMPNMNGAELTTHIRNRNDLAKLPIIMITSRSQAKHKKLALEAGVDEYVTKPYSETALVQLITTALT